MEKNISSANIYLNTPCERCGSKRRTARKWKETIQNYSGSVVVDFSQIVCTNKVCQEKFEKTLIEEAKKREVIRNNREVNKAARKTNSLLQISLAKKKRLQK